jgi:hypothetical protein
MPSKNPNTFSRSGATAAKTASSRNYMEEEDDDDDLSFFGAGRKGTGESEGGGRGRERSSSGYVRASRVGPRLQEGEEDEAKEHHHAHAHAAELNLHGMKFKKLTKLLKEKKKELNQKIHDTDREMLHTDVTGHDIYEEVEGLKAKCNAAIALCKKHWMDHNKGKYDDINKARKNKTAQPHKGIHTLRMQNLHGYSVVFPNIDSVAKKVNEFVEEHGMMNESLHMTNPMPKHLKDRHEYHVLPMRRFISRLKFQLIESMLNCIKKSDDHTDAQQKIMKTTHEINVIKREIDEIYKTRQALRKPRERKPIEFADADDLPEQKGKD